MLTTTPRQQQTASPHPYQWLTLAPRPVRLHLRTDASLWHRRSCSSVRHIRTLEQGPRPRQLHVVALLVAGSRSYHFHSPPLRGVLVVAASCCVCVVLNQHLDQSQSNSLQMGHGFRSTLLATRFIVGMSPLVGSGSPWVCVERPAPVVGPPRCSG